MVRDEELCRQLQQGSEVALEALLHRYHRPIFGYLYRLCGDRHTAEDLTQECFTRLLTRAHTYRYPQSFKAWLYVIAHNLYKDYCKAPHHRTFASTEEPNSIAAPEPLDLSERIVERAEVLQALQMLEASQREILTLRFYQDLKVDEIAEVVGVPPGTVKSRLFHAIAKLRTLLTQEGRDSREAASGRDRP